MKWHLHVIESTLWSVCEIFNDIDDQVWAWQHLYQEMVSDHIPTRQVRTRKNKLPWITNEIKKEQNKRYRLPKLYKANNTLGACTKPLGIVPKN